MLKKSAKILLILLIVISLVCVVTACDKGGQPSAVYLLVDGDIDGNFKYINLNDVAQIEFSYQDDAVTKTRNGWRLNDILSGLSTQYPNNQIFITAFDGTSALVDLPLTGNIYLYAEQNAVSVKTSDYARHVNLKNLSEITIVAKEPENVTNGLKITTPIIDGTATFENNKEKQISFGNVKLKMFEWDGVQNEYNQNKSFKYSKKANYRVEDLTGKLKNVAYFDDFDILKNAGNSTLSWKKGKARISCNNAKKAVYGIVTDTLTANYDAYYEIKQSIDNNEKVMFILPDGLSWQQINYFNDKIGLLNLTENTKNNSKKTVELATTTNLAKSEIALASIITGKSPFMTGVIKKEGSASINLGSDEIFAYAKNKGLEASTVYVEGNKTMVKTAIPATTTFPDNDGFTDKAVWEKSYNAIKDGKKFVFAHFHGIDDVNHKYGPISAEALTKIQNIETYIADLVKVFDGKVVIASDHGHYNYLENGVVKGNHGTFCNLDMYVPYYVIENGMAWSA